MTFFAFKSALAAFVASGVVLLSAPSFGAMDKPLLVVSGDFDGDGQPDKVQGFPDASNGAGRVDVFWGNPSFRVAWPTVLSAIKDPATRLANGRLGESLAVGDFNGDDLDDLAIGAPHTSSAISVPWEPPTTAARSGVYTHSGSVVVIYGCRAATCGAVACGGAGRLAVGSSLDPSITRVSGVPAQQITASSKVAYARFGKSVAAGDFNDDGYDDLAIGAPDDRVGTVLQAGSVTVVYGSRAGLDLATRQLIHQDLLPAEVSRAETNDHFGAALSAARLDLDGDDDLVVGVPDEDFGDEVNAGEADVFWGGAAGLSPSSHDRFRHTSATVGGNRSGDRLGHDLRAYNSIGFLSGTLHLGLQEAASCPAGSGFLAVPAGGLGTANPVVVLNCDAPICDDESTPGDGAPGDGALPEIPVNFIVIANRTTVRNDHRPEELPTAMWEGTDPITGAALSGADYFKSMIELLNQQLRADDGNPVCQGTDCLRLAFRRHTYYSPSMFGDDDCLKLDAIANPDYNRLDENPLAFTENCDFTTCPWWYRDASGAGARYVTFSDFAAAAVDECTLLTDDDALNVIIYDVCQRDAGGDGVVNTADDVQNCPDAKGGRGRTNGNHPYMYVDYRRALKPRTSDTPFPYAAEEHEAGHAFGLDHACDPGGHRGNTHTMQTGDCPDCLGERNLGFATESRSDWDEDVVVEVEAMIATALGYIKAWRRCR